MSSPIPPFLPFHLPSFGDEEIQEVTEVLKSGWLTTGKKVQQFESEFAAYLGCKYALAVNSGTAGLHLALEAIGIGPGDQVITTSFTFTATAEVIRYLGADPVFIDINAATCNLDPERLTEYLKRHGRGAIKAIIPVHFGGQACAMTAIRDIAQHYELKIIEDAAHALPTSSDGKMVGTISDVTVFSFYVTKTLATGEGGMVTTDDPAIAERVRVMRLHGINRDVFARYASAVPSWYYEVIAPGFKYNMMDLVAAIGIQQLRKIADFHARRQEIAARYTAAFADLPLSCPLPAKSTDHHAWHLYPVQLDLERSKISRDRFIEIMYAAGIGVSVHFIPLHFHPYWRDRYQLKPEDYPIASEVFQRIVSLPIYPKMTDADIERVIAAVRKTLAGV